MNIPLLMTPGPTYVHEDVRRAMSTEIVNPDLDLQFYEFYKDTCGKLKQLMNTKNDVVILNGEGILGLEAACCSIIEPGDNILCIDNGVFGRGFGEFATIYGAHVTYFISDYHKGIDVSGLREFLKENNNFKAATLVHCETPSGITNAVDLICPMLKEYGIITIVDSVSAVGGERLYVDEWQMDIVIGGSQKCLSAPPGLAFLSISKLAWNKILNRKSPIAGFYCSLAHWKTWYEDKWFPYTPPVNDIYALREAVRRLLRDKTALERHRSAAGAVREGLIAAGLRLYPVESFSSTVTTVMLPEEVSFEELSSKLYEEHGIMLGGAFDFLKDRVIRIGHMGENCRNEKIYAVLKAFDHVLRSLGVELKANIHTVFEEIISHELKRGVC
ncbi:aspartate aminotransferase-like enzyme [Anaerobacterium chartisolvens]|uniref:Aspartate aminotransferase-like enzyme n=1 Tax=Anaerobacterium chartisolvens TaxID=1297424 RepID=A0A369BAG6_9FIRM|nr:alanine--glyoxylate aminotransferase family protein [Anaerobacterium chartisolvens]RCX17556.1 aspartate aminotransferase-like enzyme [Anaerobacterium chartisolvens]